MYLLDIIMALGVIAFTMGSALLMYRMAVGHAADPMIINQSLAIARSYLEEIMAQDFCDPSDGGLPGACTTVCPAAEASRNLYDNVCDYDNLNDAGAKGRDGNSLSGLSNYTVTVDVVPAPAEGLGPAGNTTTAAETLRIDVTVTHSGGAVRPVHLSAYRTFYQTR